MTEEIIIDVSNCSHKRDDDCMEVPICNEYGDLMGYQSCEAQTLCPYRSQKKIERLEQEKDKYYQQTLDDEITISDLITKCNELEQENKELKVVKEQLKKWNDENLKRQDDMQLWIDLAEEQRKNYRSALEEIRELFPKQKPWKGMLTKLEEEILNKINEVLK